MSTSPSAVVAPILPAKSTVPEPELIVKVFPPSTVEVKPTVPLLESVSIVVLPARVTGPVRVTSPTSALPDDSMEVVYVPLSEIVPVVVRDMSFISVPISSTLIAPEPPVMVTSVATLPAVPRIGTSTVIVPPPLPPTSVVIVRSAASASTISPSAPPSVNFILSLELLNVESVPLIA